MSRKFTKKEDAYLSTRHAQKWSLVEIAYNLRRSVADCESRLAQLKEKRAWAEWQRRLLIEKVKTWSVEKIAAYVGLSVEDVKAKIIEMRLKS